MSREGRWALPATWRWAVARDFATVVGGGTPENAKDPGNYAPDGVPWVTPADLSGYRETHIAKGSRDLSEKGFKSCSARLLPKGSVLLSSRAPVGYCAVAANEITTNQGFKSFVLHGNEIVPEYLRYYLIASKGYLESEASGTTFLELSGARAQQLLFPIAPRKEQRRIASKIDELFSRIDEGECALARVQKLVERYRLSILKAAVSGELTRGWREKRKVHPGTPIETGEALLARILKARREAWEKAELAKMKAAGTTPLNDKWKQKYEEPSQPDTTDLPELPEGWVWTSFGQLFRVSIGSTPSRKEPAYWGGDIPWVSSGEVAFCRINATRETITREGFDNSSVKLHPQGTVLLAMIGEGKTRGQAAILDVDACHNQNAASLAVAATPIPPEYIYLFLRYRYESVRSIGQGGNQLALNGDLVKSIAIPLPPLAEIAHLCDRVDQQFSVVSAVEKNLEDQGRLVGSQRQAVLREAFKGALVRQESTDEPASKLLARIAAERGTLPVKPQRSLKKKTEKRYGQ